MAQAVKIAILADASKAVSGLKATGNAADDMGKKASRSGKLMGGLGSVLKGGLFTAGAAGVAVLGSAIGDAFAGARDAAKIARTLTNQVNAMGDAGKKAFSGATDFAEKFGSQIGRDDDDVKKVITKLSTFPSAFKAGSLGAQAMERATKAAFDLEAAGIGNAEGNIVAIGKSLDNPVRGMAALGKSGVTFTEEQKKQVAQYVKQGKLAEAQKVILAGIETNAKGAAAASASPMQKLRVAVENVAEGLAGKVLPYIEKLADWVGNKVVPKVSELADKYGPAIGTAFDKAGQAAGFLFRQLGNPVVQTVLASILAIVAAMKIWAVVTRAYTAVHAALAVVMALNPIGLVVLAVVALVAGLVLLYKRSETARKIMDAMWSGIKTATVATINFLKPVFVFFAKLIVTQIRFAVNTAKAVWKGIQWLWQFGKDIVNRAIAGFVFLRDRVVQTVRNIVNGALAVWRGILSFVTYVTTMRNRVISYIASMVSSIVGRVRSVVSAFTTIGRNIMSALGNAIEAGKQWVLDKVRALANLLPDAVKKVLGIKSPSRVFQGLGQNIVAGLAKGLDRVDSSIMNPAIKAVTQGASKLQGALDGVGMSAQGLSMTVAAPTGGSGGVAPVIINVNVYADATTDPVQVGKKIADSLATYVGATGRSVKVTP